jgi:hypothetical protein
VASRVGADQDLRDDLFRVVVATVERATENRERYESKVTL